VLVSVETVGRVTESDDRRQAQRPRENRDVRGAGSRVGRDPDYRFAIELNREARGQVVRDEDLVRPLRQVDGIVVGQAEENREHANVDVDEVAHALADH
jgi:hypothetical protein